MWEGLGKVLEKSWKSLGTRMEALERKMVGGLRLETGDWRIENWKEALVLGSEI
jgi:hypothetical protein